MQVAISFIGTNRYLDYLPQDIKYIAVDDPYMVFAYLSNIFYQKYNSNGIIADNVNLNDDAQINSNVQIDDYSKINLNLVLLIHNLDYRHE